MYYYKYSDYKVNYAESKSVCKQVQGATRINFTKTTQKTVAETGVSDPHKFLCGSGIPKMSTRIRIQEGK